MKIITIKKEDIEMILVNNLNRYNAKFHVDGDLYHDNYPVSKREVMNKIMSEILKKGEIKEN